MRFISLTLITLFFCGITRGQADSRPRNIFIITADGLRWQEVFEGASPEILGNPEFVRDTNILKNLYYDSTPALRRKKLMPFFWNLIVEQGQLYGNRRFGNKVNVRNLFKISYPGYNEILTGFADPVFIPNLPLNNRSINVLEFFSTLPAYSGKVAAFSSWNIFPFILNEKRSKLPVNSGYGMNGINSPDSMQELVHALEDQVLHKTHTRNDLLTFFAAQEYISREHPKMVLLGLGETDEFAHQRRYDIYLQKITAFDKMVADLWYLVQTDPFYRDNTYFIITTDHGRGKEADNWCNHGMLTRGSGQAWYAILGPGIRNLGEVRTKAQSWQKQLASTVAMLAGETFNPPHRVGEALVIPMKNTPDGNTAMSDLAK